jgi:predicted nucleic acid-binding protein
VTLVIDSSAVLKWVLNETDSAAARQILFDFQAERVELIAPALVHSEVGNVLAKLVRGGEITFEQADHAFALVLQHSPRLHDSPGLSRVALKLASAHRQSYYDCLFLALALERRCGLVTADERFFRGMRLEFPTVQLVRNYVPSDQLPR